MDITRVNPYRFCQGIIRLVPTPPAKGGHPVRGATRDLPLPGGRFPPDPDYVGCRGMGDDMWRGQNEGKVRNTCQFMTSFTVSGEASKLRSAHRCMRFSSSCWVSPSLGGVLQTKKKIRRPSVLQTSDPFQDPRRPVSSVASSGLLFALISVISRPMLSGLRAFPALGAFQYLRCLLRVT